MTLPQHEQRITELEQHVIKLQTETKEDMNSRHLENEIKKEDARIASTMLEIRKPIRNQGAQNVRDFPMPGKKLRKKKTKQMAETCRRCCQPVVSGSPYCGFHKKYPNERFIK